MLKRPVLLSGSALLPGDIVQRLNGTRNPGTPILIVLRTWKIEYNIYPFRVEVLCPDGQVGLLILTGGELFRRFNYRKKV